MTLLLFFLVLTSIALSQPATKEMAVSTLKGDTKCAYETFLKYIKKNIIYPDSTIFAPSIDLLHIKQFYIIGCYADARSQSFTGAIRKVKLYYQLKLQKTGESKECNDKDFKMLGMAFVDHKSEATIHDIYVAAAQYDKADFLGSDAAFVKQNGKWGMIDKNGTLTIPTVYDSLAVHSLGLRALQHGEWTIIDWDTGQKKSKKNYSRISSSFPRVKDVRLAAVEYEGKQGFINQSYEEIVPTIYDEVKVLAFRFAVGKRNGKTVLLSEKTGKELTPLKYDDIRYHSDNLLSVGIRKTNTYGLIDATGKEVLPPVYNELRMNLAKGVFGAAKEGKYAVMSYETFAPLTTFKYDVLKAMWGDTMMVKINAKWGAVNTRDEVVIPIRFDKGNESLSGEFSFMLNDQRVLFKDRKCVEHCELLKMEK